MPWSSLAEKRAYGRVCETKFTELINKGFTPRQLSAYFSVSVYKVRKLAAEKNLEIRSYRESVKDADADVLNRLYDHLKSGGKLSCFARSEGVCRTIIVGRMKRAYKTHSYKVFMRIIDGKRGNITSQAG